MSWRDASIPLAVTVGLALLVWYRSGLRQESGALLDVVVNLCGSVLIVLIFRLSNRVQR